MVKLNKKRGIAAQGLNPHVRKRVPLRKKIKAMFWDVDGTLYGKLKGIEKEKKWLFYNAYAICRTDPSHNPFDTRKKAVFPTLESVPKEISEAYDAMYAHKDHNPNGRYVSHGGIFMGEFGKDQCYAAKVMSLVDFDRVLSRDEPLIKLFEELMQTNPQIMQGILTNDVCETTMAVFPAIGLDISGFQHELIDRMFPPNLEYMQGSRHTGAMGFFNAYNMLAKKPELEPYRQVLKATGLESEPDRLLYIGDAELKDIMPPNELGITTCLVRSGKSTSEADFTLDLPHELIKLVMSD